MKSFLYSLWEVVEITLVAVIAVLIIRYFLVQPFLVNGSSMEPNFSNNDYLLIDEITYHFRKPERGEAIVFHYPRDKKFYYIKRIVGLPGEKVEIKNGKVFIFNKEYPEGFVLDENYLPSGLETDGKEERVALAENEYFAFGDNRNFSFDSRSWGAVKYDNIVGLVRLRLWPLNKVMAFGFNENYQASK